MDEPRRRVPRTDALLAHPALAPALASHGRELVKAAVVRAQGRARAGEIDPEPRAVAEAALRLLAPVSSLRPVLNATGVVVHTNLGRAPLSAAAREAVARAAGHVDLEIHLADGRRSRRGEGARRALLDAVPDAEDALVVNNGAAALVLATTALAGPATPEVVVSRGEMVEIGAGFRLPDLVASTGAVLREVGTTNRTHLADYEGALTPRTGAILKVHPSNFRVEGFIAGAGVAELAGLRRPDGSAVPLVVDVGSGLLRPDRSLPDEPDAATALRAGAAVVTASGDKLLGGPQAGLVLGDAAVVGCLRRHPLARAVRVDKLTLTALEATLRGPEPPVTRARRLTRDGVRARTAALAEATGGRVVEVEGRIGGGGAPGVPLPGLAVALPAPGGDADAMARALRTGTPAVLARIEGGACLVDLRCIEPADDAALTAAIRAALAGPPHATPDDAGEPGPCG